MHPADRLSEGVEALRSAKRRVDAWLEDRGLDCSLSVGADVGPVVCGPIGPVGHERFDVFGGTVSHAALLVSKGFRLSPEIERRLAG
jgi:class 3 adenylate cyclase